MIISSVRQPLSVHIWFYLLMGLAVGAGVFLVRRRPHSIVAWIGLLFWGGLATWAVVGAIVQ